MKFLCFAYGSEKDWKALSRGEQDAQDEVLRRRGDLVAASLDEAIRLLADTPCARARRAIEIRPIAVMNSVRVDGVTP